MGTFNISYEELLKLYIDDKLTTVQIANMFGVNDSTVYRRLVKCGIQVRGKRVANQGKVFSVAIRLKMSEKSNARNMQTA